MAKCEGKTKEGLKCKMSALQGARFCQHHLRQRGKGHAPSIDLSLGKKKWRILSKAQDQHEKLEKLGDHVVLTDNVKIFLPHNSMENGVMELHLRGPVTLKSLLKSIDDAYLEHGGTVRNMGDIADGIFVEKLERVGDNEFHLIFFRIAFICPDFTMKQCC